MKSEQTRQLYKNKQMLDICVYLPTSCHISLTMFRMRSVSNNYIRPLQQREINDRETAVHERRPTAEARTERKSKDAVINQLFELFRSFSPNLCPSSPPCHLFSPVTSCICCFRNTKLRDRGRVELRHDQLYLKALPHTLV